MLSLEELERLAVQPFTCFHKVRQALHVTLHPRYLNNLELGLLDYFNKQINRWHPKLNGILANYGKLKLKSPHGMLLNEEAHIHLDVVSEFWVFRPEIGSILQGIVTKTSQKHVACLVHGVFNVPCYHPNNLGSTPWWGMNAQIGKPVRFKVVKMDVSQKIPFILGELEKWSLDGNPIKDSTSTIEHPVEEVGLDQWENVATGNDSQGENSDADSGIQSLPKRPKLELGGIPSMSPVNMAASIIPPNLLPLTPLQPAETLPKPIKPSKTKKNAKKTINVDKGPLFSSLDAGSIQASPQPPNIDDLIKSIKIPNQTIDVNTSSTPIKGKEVKVSKASPKKETSSGEVPKRQCSFCDQVVPKKGLKNHIISLHFKDQLLAKIPDCAPGKSGPYHCPKCGKVNKDRTDILRHFANFHNELQQFCSEAQLQGREVLESGIAKVVNTSSAPIKGKEVKVSKASPKKKTSSGKVVESGIAKVVEPIPTTSKTSIENNVPEIEVSTTNTKKKKKHKKRKDEQEQELNGAGNLSTLSNTTATPIRNTEVQSIVQEDTFSVIENSGKKKKKKKNKEKDKEKEAPSIDESAIKGETMTIRLDTKDPNTSTMDDTVHKKTKKKKKDKKNI